jgi:hypothetical protein
MPNLDLDTSDATELADLLQFVNDWLASDPTHIDASLTRFVGTHGYNLQTLRTDLDRFTFLLGGNDGEALFQPGPD